ncbi:hypothetical protein SKAU_G00020500 [Synaphobranchus kaupii]|uniref:Gypsy retrotransposon integrase-like protein 1 n=1 Tax=Synaphobranchus kaupii TaxID=118154 RepID=A0A9Q1GDJ8_SYNKA|nr:hypothetical protein SKAU_G00020500 [Synaphobranchus kaupii]
MRVKALLDAAHRSQEAAVIKVTAHQETKTVQGQGNAWADEAAKLAASLPCVAAAQPVSEREATDEEIKMTYDTETDSEIQRWKHKGAKQDSDGLWRLNHSVVAPTGARQPLIQLYHGITHEGPEKQVAQMQRTWWWPGMKRDIYDYTSRCLICLETKNHTTRKKIPMGCAPRPKGLWTHLQMDFTGPLPPSGRYTYLFVVIDQYTRWVEVFPTRNCTAATAARLLATEIFPRWGLPYQIHSDNGTHFTGKVMKEAMKTLGIKQKFSMPYHPQSTRMVERMNQTIKTKLTAEIKETGKGWHGLLPAVLWKIRASPNKVTQLTPFELMTGRAMTLRGDAPPQGTDDSGGFQQMLRVKGVTPYQHRVLQLKAQLYRAMLQIEEGDSSEKLQVLIA